MTVQQDGGRGECASYQVQCSNCGLHEKEFSNDGTRRSAISQWNKFAKKSYEEMPTPKTIAARNI